MKKIILSKKIVICFILIGFCGLNFNFQVKSVAAQVLGTGVTPVHILSDSSPTGIANTTNILQTTVNTYAEKIRTWILDGLAWHIAKMIVQQITASVVNWINSGFSGSPSFLTNPGGFFADIGDQVTGNFISNTGILSGLCSPFNVDIRLTLALGQAGYGQTQRYTCTLNSVISNVKNSTVNGASIGGFMNGDFKQGGWPAFIAISQSNNNPSGIYLQAHSDLLQKIDSQQGTKNQQLLQGGGFLSWDSCKNISTEDVSSLNIQAQNDGNYGITDQLNKTGNQKVTLDPGKVSGGATSIQKNVDKNTGAVSYQSCETQTPGSVINGQLEKSLGSGVDQLNLADSINEITDALMAQLVNQVLQTGLGTVASRPSGETQSYIDQLSASATATTSLQGSVNDIQDGFTKYISNAQTIKDVRQTAIEYFEVARADYSFASNCYLNLLASNSFSLYTDSATINTTLNSITTEITQLNIAEQPYIDKFNQASSTLNDIVQQSKLTSVVGSSDSLQKASDALSYITATQSPILDTSGPDKDAITAKSIADKYDKQAQNYLSQCKAFGGN